MTTNPRSLAYDPSHSRLICEICVEWVTFDDLYKDEEGHRWDLCQSCGEAQKQVERARAILHPGEDEDDLILKEEWL